MGKWARWGSSETGEERLDSKDTWREESGGLG